eukprot:878365-Pyramimonas_sp.AAC.1
MINCSYASFRTEESGNIRRNGGEVEREERRGEERRGEEIGEERRGEERGEASCPAVPTFWAVDLHSSPLAPCSSPHPAIAQGDVLAFLVHWRAPGIREGQPVYLDNHQRAIFSMSILPGLHFRAMPNAMVVHPDVGIRMLKAKAEGRPTLPANMFRLKRMWNTGLEAQRVGSVLCGESDL